ncbi:phage integrase N-terminal SAM-like domain-containing protein [Puniceicoccaceae bacterium K14]|nr:phage integrase N-terminal SAM-like domain-containing protein [Puniceicoccaceae bacterium K14]
MARYIINVFCIMFTVPTELKTKYSEELNLRKLSAAKRSAYMKWLRYYLDYCHKYHHRFKDPDSLAAFTLKLSEKGQSKAQQFEAAVALKIYFELVKKKEGLLTGKAQKALGDDWDLILEKLKKSIQTLHYSPSTLNTYSMWAIRFRDFLISEGKTASTCAQDAADFFTYLANKRKVAASTQNQASPCCSCLPKC